MLAAAWFAVKLFMGKWIERLTGAISALLGFIGRYPWQAALIASLLLSGWLWRGRQAARVEAARWEQVSVDQKADFDRASKEAAALAIAQVKAVEARSAHIAKENAIEERALRAELGARAAANAERMRADKYCRRLAAPASPDNPAPVDPGPGADAVILERRDYDTLIDNTIRLKAANAWGVEMVRDGLAKTPVDWPEPALSAVPQP